MADMGNVKVAYRGGDKASKPGVRANPGHPEQRPGNADGTPSSSMTWKGCSMNASKSEYKK